MKIEIKPRSFFHFENISRVLFNLHPIVLDELIEMERSFGKILGFVDLKNINLEEREFFCDNQGKWEKVDEINYKEPTYDEEIIYEEPTYDEEIIYKEPTYDEEIIYEEPTYDEERFYELKKYLILNTDEYIPMKLFIEIEDPVVGRKVRELVSALESTRAIGEFIMNKQETDEMAYFAEGYGLQMNEEQRKKYYKFIDKKDTKSLLDFLFEKKLYGDA